MKKSVISILSAYLLLLFAPMVSAAPGYTEINNELFDKAHLKNIKQPGTLRYEFHRQSFTEGNRDDVIEMNVSNIRNTGRCDLAFNFFTGEYNRPYEPMSNKRGNGVAVLYLEYDIHEMDRLTGGEWRYFQRKLKSAFASGADKKEVEIDYNGKKVKGVQYIVQPYIKDPKNSRYKLYAGKYYIFTLSEDIPGELYQVRTIVPDGKVWKEGDPILLEETLTFKGYDAS